jgi:hypothetical protein
VKGPFGFDPAACQYGPATASVRRVLEEWMALDWFVPAAPGAEEPAVTQFREHHRRTRAYAPDLYAPKINLRVIRGGWEGFADLCAQVRSNDRWDWKYGVLKPLCHRHTKAQGWSGASDPSVVDGRGPGGLFFILDGHVFWNNLGPHLPLDAALPKPHADVAGFYLGYACLDTIDAVEWQLAEPGADPVSENPFFPLLRCYAAGLYPFALGRGDATLFAFPAA